MSDTSISRRQGNKGIDVLDEQEVTDELFQDHFLGNGLLSALGKAVAAGRDMGPVVAYLRGHAEIQLIKRMVSRIPFDPEKVLGKGWSWWKGPVDGNGLEGDEDCDQRSLVLDEVDFAQVLREICLKEGEPSIKGNEKYPRLKASGHILLDPGFGWALYKEPGQKTLRWLYDTFGITYLDFFGKALRSPRGHRHVLYLYRIDDGCWLWHVHWLAFGWHGRHASAVLPASSAQALATQS